LSLLISTYLKSFLYSFKIKRQIVKTLKNLGAPTTAKKIGLKPDTLAKALTIAQDLRPERYTILKEVDMTFKKAIELAKSTKVL